MAIQMELSGVRAPVGEHSSGDQEEADVLVGVSSRETGEEEVQSLLRNVAVNSAAQKGVTTWPCDGHLTWQ